VIVLQFIIALFVASLLVHLYRWTKKKGWNFPKFSLSGVVLALLLVAVSWRGYQWWEGRKPGCHWENGIIGKLPVDCITPFELKTGGRNVLGKNYIVPLCREYRDASGAKIEEHSECGGKIPHKKMPIDPAWKVWIVSQNKDMPNVSVTLEEKERRKET
jgi:hypothetical protein